ncbi:hypothetical protein HUJ05_006511 [Dendroctonus ponderosae]|nr:hypothetical protein HUJ05_006511 [Dendroctonus ponderosae]
MLGNEISWPVRTMKIRIKDAESPMLKKLLILQPFLKHAIYLKMENVSALSKRLTELHLAVVTHIFSKPYRPDPCDLVYADVDYKSNYGPINYKAASVYAALKRNKSNNRMEDIDKQDLL